MDIITKLANTANKLGQKTVLQNNDTVFEMKRKQFNLIHIIISILSTGFIFYIFWTLFQVQLTQVYQQFQENGFSSLIQFSTPNHIAWFVLGYIVITLLSIITQGMRITYFRIDSMQIQTKTIWETRLGREGKTYFLTNPATIKTEMKGVGKNKHYKIVYTSAGGEKMKIKLWGQVFGGGALELLDEWVKEV